MSGRFITFEGGEGAGKSTQIAALAQRLADAGMRTIVTREPGGTPTAEMIRAVLLSGAAQNLGADAEAVLFAAARADHVDRVIAPALRAGTWVLCDRFFDSTRVYQGVSGGVSETTLSALERAAVGRTRPDLTIILDVPVGIGLARAAKRLEASGGAADRFEREDAALHEARRQGFLALAEAEPERCVVIDATRPPEATLDAVWQAVSDRLIKHAA